MIALMLAFILVGSEAHADFSGSVVSVLDGDTIEVLHSHHPERIRFNGIDCPQASRTFEILVGIEFVGGNTTAQLV